MLCRQCEHFAGLSQEKAMKNADADRRHNFSQKNG
jgi:hypothetical protein